MVDRRIALSRAQEARGAKEHGGRRTVGSGNTPWQKNDVRVDRSLLIEYKRTDKDSITIRRKDLETLRTNALLEGRTPVLGIEVGQRDWTLLEAHELQRLLDIAADHERVRSGSAGTELGDGEVSGVPDGVVLPRDGAQEQEAAAAGEGRLSRRRRGARVSDTRGVS